MPRHVVATTQYRRATLVALCTAVLATQVDTTVVNLAAHPIGEYFSASVDALQWVMDSYNLTYAVLLLSGGLLADLYGRRLVFMAGAVVFTVASLLGAFAPSILMLIGSRALAGLGAALTLPASLAIIRVVWHEPVERSRVLGRWAACNGLALIIGPTVGGFLVSSFGWRSIFLVVIPLSLIALVLATLFVPESSAPDNRNFDIPGQLWGAIALGGLVFSVIYSHNMPDIATITFFVFLFALGMFIRTESKTGALALVPLDIFRVREFSGAMVATAGMTFGMYGTLFLLPLTWQVTGRFGALEAGVALMPMALVFVMVSSFSGWMAKKIGTRLMAFGGVALIGCGLLTIGFCAHDGPIILAETGLALTGLGMGLATGQLMGLAVGVASARRAGTASALINVARMAGATMGIAILGATFAIVRDAPSGLRLSMLLGGLIQILCAIVAWAVTRPAIRAAC